MIGTALPRIVSLHHVNNPLSWPESLREIRIVLRDFRQILHAKDVDREIFSVYFFCFQYFDNFLGEIHQNTKIAALPPKSRPDSAAIWDHTTTATGHKTGGSETGVDVKTEQLILWRDQTMMNFFKNFSKDEDGAVTVDWVVLTAAVVGLGIAAISTVRGGIDSMAGDISTSLTDGGVAAVGTLGSTGE
ncbi:Flp family type IVb pilin [Roseovarius nitratireducens]|uniref:Flp family type IVb pilin n=1 Tax=Roseovarius nitratireducens TaxID=2044597 RepID=UPI0030B82205